MTEMIASFHRSSAPKKTVLILAVTLLLSGFCWAAIASYHYAQRRAFEKTMDSFIAGNAQSGFLKDPVKMKQVMSLTYTIGTHAQISDADIEFLIAQINGPPDQLLQKQAMDCLDAAIDDKHLSAEQKGQATQATLAVLSKNPELLVRLSGARLLGNLNDKRAIPALLTLLSDSNPKVKRRASKSLVELGYK